MSSMSGRIAKSSCSIVHVTYTSTGRTVNSTDLNVAMRRSTIRKTVRDALGKREIYKDLLYFTSNVTISKSDEIILNSVTRKIEDFIIARDGKDNVHHYEVTLI